jgi:hypothetical protein
MGLTGILVLLISNAMMISAADPDLSKMGVSNGDTFTFVVDKATSLFTEEYIVGFDYTTFDDLSIAEGSEFTMKITNTTVIHDAFFDEYNILAEFSDGMETITMEVDLFDNDFLTFTDWTFWETNLTAEMEAAKAAGEISSFTVENGEEEFVLKHTNETKTDGGSSKESTEWRIEKATGVINYYSDRDKISSPILSLDFETTFRRVGYDKPGSASAFLPGFEWYIGMLALTLIVLPLRQKLNRK